MQHKFHDEDSMTAGAPIKLEVILELEDELEEGADLSAVAPFYPGKKNVNYWVICSSAPAGGKPGQVSIMLLHILIVLTCCIAAAVHQEVASLAKGHSKSRMDNAQGQARADAVSGVRLVHRSGSRDCTLR